MSYTASQILIAFMNFARSKGYKYKNTGGHSYRHYKNEVYPFITLWGSKDDGLILDVSERSRDDSRRYEVHIEDYLSFSDEDWLQKKWLESEKEG
jgi:hypothetical protein